MPTSPPSLHPSLSPPSRDHGRLLALVLCTVLGTVGLLPIALAITLRADAVRAWATDQTTLLLQDKIGLAADFNLTLSMWPLAVELEHLKILASDGKAPALTAKSLHVRPRLFSLFAGKLDAGHISLDSPHIRLVVENGKVTNFTLPEPATPAEKDPLAGAGLPFSSLAVTDAVLDIRVDGTELHASGVDLDVFSGPDQALEVALRASHGQVHTQRGSAHDEDVLCQLDARVRFAEDEVLIRRLSLLGAVDQLPELNSPPTCGTEVLTDNPNRVLLRLSSFSLLKSEGELHQARGHILARAPVTLANRYTDEFSFKGWVGLSGDAHWSASQTQPTFHGKVKAGGLKLDQFMLARSLKTDLHWVHNRVLLPRASVEYGDGTLEAEEVQIDLSSEHLPMTVAHAHVQGLGFPSLMEDLGITPRTIVHWDLRSVHLNKFAGTLTPLKLEGDFDARTENFEVFDRSVHDPGRAHMIGIPKARLHGTFGVQDDSIRFDRFDVRFGQSALKTSVHIGFDNQIFLAVPDGGIVDFADLSPVAGLPWSGRAELGAKMSGPMDNPVLVANLKVDDFSLGGFPFGNLVADNVRFVPLRLDIPLAQLRSGDSQYELRSTALDFDSDPTLIVTTDVRGTRFRLADFFRMWHLEDDPNWAGLAARGTVRGKVRYVLGGREDACRTGRISVRGAASLAQATIYDERYQNTHADFDFLWSDLDAGHLGLRLKVPSLSTHMGSGTIVGSIDVARGGSLSGNLLASRIPISALRAFSQDFEAKAHLNAQVEISGTLDAIGAKAQTQISPVRIGSTRLPASSLALQLKPVAQKYEIVGRTACGAPVRAPAIAPTSLPDPPKGVIHVNGALFGRQAMLRDVQITRQTNKHVRGLVTLKDFDLIAVTPFVPALQLLEPRPQGHLTGTLALEDLPWNLPGSSRGELTMEALDLTVASSRIQVSPNTRIRLGHGRLRLDPTSVTVRTPTGQEGRFSLRGKLTDLNTNPQIKLLADLKPTPLEAFRPLIPNAATAEGRLEGSVSMSGALATPIFAGSARLKRGKLTFRGPPHQVSNLDLKLSLKPGELQLDHARFRVGGGSVRMRGTAPLSGLSVGLVQAYITARDVDLPLPTGLSATVDADLQARWQPSAEGRNQPLSQPRIVGSVSIDSLLYALPVKLSVDISDLAQRGKRTEFDSYQLDGDLFSFNVDVRATQPLRLSNNLFDASLSIENEVLQLTGTNQRFGVRGALKIAPGGHIQLRQNEFEIQQGRVRFDDPSRIVPSVDVTAVTEYRRFGSGTDAGSASTISGNNANVGEWRVSMRAHGDAETLRIDLDSQPVLSQDDIFLLLTMGLTRAEFDQARQASLSETFALETLSALTGADRAVTEAIPVIDEFRLGSAYSSKTAQSEPTITIGKQLSSRIRAFVTSSVGETGDVRSNVQVKVNRKVSIEGSYDNLNDLARSSVGNLGADIRWRLDFE